MKENFNDSTHKSLLDRLRVLADQKAWSQFVKRYSPRIQAWCRGKGLNSTETEELIGELLLKLTKSLPRFDYQPEKGSFRGWLKTIVMRAIAQFFEARNQRPDVGTGNSAVLQQLLEHPEDVDDLVTSIHDCTEELLCCVRDALGDVQAVRDEKQNEPNEDERQKSWAVFQRIFLEEKPTADVAAEFNLTYHAAVMRARRVVEKVQTRVLQLALQRGLIAENGDSPKG